MIGLGRDLVYAIRLMRRRVVPTTVTVISLAIGIGAVTAVFSVINALVLRPLPVRHPEQLVELLSTFPGDPRMNVFSWTFYEHYRDHNHVFSDVLAISPAQFRVAADSSTPADLEAVSGSYVVGTFFSALGLEPAVGRLIGPQDDQAGAGDPAVAVISWPYWQRRFNSRPSVLNTRIVVDGVSVTIIGVAPRAFRGVQTGLVMDVWVPTAMEPLVHTPSARASGQLMTQVMARLKPGVSLAAARAEMRVLDRMRSDELSQRSRDPQWQQVVLDVEPAAAGLSALREVLARPLWLLMAIAAVLLVLMSMNIAGMLLAQSERRRREMAVRVTLGAGAFSLTRQVLTESLLLSALGALLGMAFAHPGAVALVRAWPVDPRWHVRPVDIPVHPDWRVLLFSALIAVGSGVLFGLAPIWHALAATPFAVLREAGAVAEARSRKWVGQSLVAAQVALSIALLSGSALIVRHLLDLRYAGLGFDRNGVLLVSLDPSRTSYAREDLSRRYQDVLARFEVIPGVRFATISATTPIEGGAASRFVEVEGFQEAPEARRRVSLNMVGPRYFETLGTPRLAGRDFVPADQGSALVAIVNEAFARHYFDSGPAVGRRFRFEGQAQAYEIVGLVADAKYSDVHEAAPRTVYLHAFQESRGRLSQFAIRSTRPPLAIAGEVRRAVHDAAAGVQVAKIMTLADQVDLATRPERLIAALSGFFGLLGAALAVLGVYGLVAYSVARRIPEIGIRLALGATPRHVMSTILKGAAGTVTAGLVAAIPLVYYSRRVASALITGLPSGGLLPIVAAAGAMTAVLLLAAYLPARRASRIDPLEALRRV